MADLILQQLCRNLRLRREIAEAVMDELKVPQKDYGYTVAMAFQTYSGDIVNISGATVTVRAWAPGTPGTALFTTSGTIAGATSGTATFAIHSGAFMSVALYMAEAETSWSGVKQTYGPFWLKVQEGG